MRSFAATTGQVEVGNGALKCLGGHGNGLRQGGMGVNGKPDIRGVAVGFDGQGNLGNEVTGIGANNAPSNDLLRFLIKQQLGQTLITAQACLLYTSPSPRDRTRSRMPSSA